ncbi:hypothetical protein [Fervidobacterium thailandense]|uniref:Uncharacterized protein n=1 Tax=Fervidobacterium thailandense TaxID=1008305 RepID=A0A1E3G2A1_9BACT|nr:hypothetical protein [Fervidobacterium thailandense]ODN30250.1 hypothetical protein A4H02_06750 [Fervidobacterium thailandense]
MRNELEAFEFLKEKLFNELLFSLTKEKLCTFLLQAFLISEGNATIKTINGQRVFFINQGFEFSRDFLKLSTRLGIKPSKLESIIMQIKMQTIIETQNEKEYVREIIFHTEEAIEIRSNSEGKTQLVLFIRDKVARDIIERTLKKENKSYDYSFNRDILILSREALKVIMNEFLSEDDIKEFKSRINIMDRKEMIAAIVDTLFQKLLGQEGLRLVRKLFDFIKEVISQDVSS